MRFGEHISTPLVVRRRSVVVDFLFIVTPIVGVCNCSMFPDFCTATLHRVNLSAGCGRLVCPQPAGRVLWPDYRCLPARQCLEHCCPVCWAGLRLRGVLYPYYVEYGKFRSVRDNCMLAMLSSVDLFSK